MFYTVNVDVKVNVKLMLILTLMLMLILILMLMSDCPDSLMSPTSLPAWCFQENIILRKNSSLTCLTSPEESLPHQRFHNSIQSWSLANEGFVKSLVTLPDNTHHQDSQSQSQAPQISSESLISDQFLQEPLIMEETSLVVRDHSQSAQAGVNQVEESGDHTISDHQLEVEEEKVDVEVEEVEEKLEEMDEKVEEVGGDAVGEKQELENYQNYKPDQDFAPKYQNGEIEKLFELADKKSNLVDTTNKKDDHNNQVTIVIPSNSSKSSQQSKSTVKENQSEDETQFQSDDRALTPAVKPVPAPRRFFLEDSSEVATDFQLEKFSTVQERAKTFSFISSYYHHGAILASAGTISKIC